MRLLLGLFLTCMVVHVAKSQQNPIQGTVKDLYLSQPIPGASIIINGKDTVQSDERGMFRTKLDTLLGLQLDIFALGYESRHIRVSGNSGLDNIFLTPVNYQNNFIQVRGLYNGKNLLRTPGSIATLVEADFRRNSQTNLQNSFNLLPGIRLELRNINTGARILLRGYGNQNNNVGIGYKAYYNDIPLTDADGTTNLDDIDFATLGRVELFRGPVSSVYGTGIGGVVNLTSLKAPQGTTIGQSLLTGTNALFRTTTSVGIGNDRTNILFNYGQQRTDGYRLNSNSKKDYWDLNATIYHIPKSTITLFAQYTKSDDQLSGQVDSLGLINYPDSADISYIKNGSHSELESIRLGISQEYVFSPQLSNKTTFFLGTQEIGQSMSTILTKTNRSNFGLRTAFIYSPWIGNVATKFTLGLEGLKNIIYQKTYNLVNGALGTLRTDQELKPLQWNVFGGIELTIAKNTLMVFSASANFITYDNEDLRVTGSGYVNQSGFRTFKPVITPRWVINHLISKSVSVYANYSMGYAQPGTNQFIISQTGKIINDVGPEISNTFEVGAKASLLKNALSLDFAFFNMEVSQKLLTQNFAASGGQPFYTTWVNAGSVNFTGMEFSMNYVYKPDTRPFIRLIRQFMTYTYNKSRNSDLKSDNNNNSATKDYTNLRVSGLPQNVLNSGIDLETAAGFYLNLTEMFTDRMPITLDNTAFADSYNLVNIRAGFRKEFLLKNKPFCNLDIFWGNNNIFDTRYAQFVVINLPTISGTTRKFFTPGPKSSLYAGITIGFRLK